MNCQECQQHLLDYAYGELPPQLEEEFSSALQECPACQQELARLRVLRESVQKVLPMEEPPALVRANILREARKQLDAQNEAANASLWDSFRSLLFHPSFAIAAALLLVLVVTVVLQDDGAFESAAHKEVASKSLEPPSEASPTPPKSPAAALPTDSYAEKPEVEEEPEPLAAAERHLAEDGDEAAPQRDALADTTKTAPKKAAQAKVADIQPQSRAKREWAPKTKPSPVNPAPTRAGARSRADDLEAKVEAPRQEKSDKEGVWEADKKRVAVKTEALPSNESPRKGSAKAKTAVSDSALTEKRNRLVDSAKTTANMYDLGETASPRSVQPSTGDGLYLDNKNSGNNSSSFGFNSAGTNTDGGLSGAYTAPGNSTVQYKEAEQAKEERSKKDVALGNNAADSSTTGADTSGERYNKIVDERYNRGDFRGAIQEFNEFINEVPSSSNYYALALFKKGKSEFNQGLHQQAAATFRRVISEHPTSDKASEARYYLAQALLKINPASVEAERILNNLARGGGAYADKARQDHDRAFGKKAPRPASKQKRKKKDAPYEFDELEQAAEPDPSEPAGK